jgi:hypothetical protein
MSGSLNSLPLSSHPPHPLRPSRLTPKTTVCRQRDWSHNRKPRLRSKALGSGLQLFAAERFTQGSLLVTGRRVPPFICYGSAVYIIASSRLRMDMIHRVRASQAAHTQPTTIWLNSSSSSSSLRSASSHASSTSSRRWWTKRVGVSCYFSFQSLLSPLPTPSIPRCLTLCERRRKRRNSLFVAIHTATSNSLFLDFHQEPPTNSLSRGCFACYSPSFFNCYVGSIGP